MHNRRHPIAPTVCVASGDSWSTTLERVHATRRHEAELAAAPAIVADDAQDDAIPVGAAGFRISLARGRRPGS
jgi:hypothetical protein